MKPLIDEQFTRDWVGHDSQSRFALSDRLARVRSNSMTRFYDEVIANLVRRAALLYEHGMARQGGAAMVRGIWGLAAAGAKAPAAGASIDMGRRGGHSRSGSHWMR